MKNIKKIIIFMLCIIFILNATPTITYACEMPLQQCYDNDLIMVKASHIVRSSPNSKSKKIGTIPKNAVVHLLGKKRDHFKIYDGKHIGYIKKCKYVKSSSIYEYLCFTNRNAAEYKATVDTDHNIYSDKDMTKCCGVLDTNTEVICIDFDYCQTKIIMDGKIYYIDSYDTRVVPIFKMINWKIK